ncbi:MAG TPA: glutamyl-tRNA reductase [Pseudomonadales bacterium]|nr:glutamyl-tRNA reductase [Pseudomonadales bacterium]
MSLLAVGINHNSASLALRERVSFAPELMVAALRALSAALGNVDAVILSTCNRTELYIGADVDAHSVLEWLAAFHGLDGDELWRCHYCHRDEAAARHLMLVACGLDSLVLGEPQIFGQMKSAFAQAVEAGTLRGPLNQTFQQVFSVSKRVRAETAIGHNPVSVAYAAVRLAQRIFADLHNNTALLIGAGKTVELVARHLREQGIARIIIANRTLERAQLLAESLQAEAILLGDIPDRLHEADIVISSTASQLPVLGKGAVEQALKKRRHQPMFMVDIAMPRDIEPQVAELDDVYLYTVDDLRDVIDENLRARELAAEDARILIEEGVALYQREKRRQEAASSVVEYRQKAEVWRDAEVERALRSIARGNSAEDAMKVLAHNLTNKLLHHPTEMLKQLSDGFSLSDGRD